MTLYPVGAAVLGSVASQGVGLATGIQQKFSFKGVAIAALSAGVVKGLGPKGGIFEDGAFSGVKSGVLREGLRGAAASAITQGIATATGLQSKFSFAGVAAAGVAAGVGHALGGNLPALEGKGLTPGNIAAHTAVGAASLIASAATRSAINGSSFSKNIEAGLPDVIGQVIGRAIGGAVRHELDIKSRSRAIAETILDRVAKLGKLDGEKQKRLVENFQTSLRVAAEQTLRGETDGIGNLLVEIGDALGVPRAQYLGDSSSGSDYELEIRGFDVSSGINELDESLHYAFSQVDALSNPALGFAEFDKAALTLGLYGDHFGDKAAEYLEENPGVELALEALNLLLTVAGGPIRYALGEALGQGVGHATEWAAERFLDNGYVGKAVFAGAAGAVGLGLVLAGSVKIGEAVQNARTIFKNARQLVRSRLGTSEFTRNYLNGSGGRWGSNATRRQNYEIAREYDGKKGYTVTDGGGFGSEEFIKGPGPRTNGGTFVDITVEGPDGRFIRIQTVDTYADGVTPTVREQAAIDRIRARHPSDEVIAIPKRQ